MLAARNTMAHVYSADTALSIYESLSGFAPHLRVLLERLLGVG